MKSKKNNNPPNSWLKRILSATIMVIFIIGIMNISFAIEKSNFKNRETHKKIWDLGLYKGGIPEYYPPDDQELAVSINRETGIMMVLRLLGYERQFYGLSDEETDNILSKYTDASKISNWARKVIAFAVKNKFVAGVSENKLGVKDGFTGKMFSIISLKAIGYNLVDKDYDCACAALAEKGGLSIRQAVLFNDKKLIKDDIIGMSYGLLKAERADKKTVIKKLVEDGIAYKDSAMAYNLIEKE